MATPVKIPPGFEIESSPTSQPTRAPAIPPGFEVEKQFGIDWSRPIPEVRAEVAKLPEADRQEALRQWADAYVARERAQGAGAEDLVRSFARGTIAGPWLDEANAATAAGLHRLTGGALGAPYEEAVAYQRAQDRAVDVARPVSSGAAQVAGALAGGGLAYRGARALGLPAATTLPRQMAVGAGLGTTHAASYGAGVSEGDVGERIAAGVRAAPIGAVTGFVVPPAIRAGAAAARPVIDWASPTFARLGANVRDIPRRIGIHASADGGGPVSPGARAAAEEVVANAAVRGGATGRQLTEALDPDVGYFWPGQSGGSRAQDARVLADIDPALQRLASSAGRASTEAGTTAAAVMRARQTGLTPDIPRERAIVAAAGVPTRSSMARARAGARPVGQFERIRDAFRRAMLIADETFHGHLGTGRRTEQAIVEQARREADELYATAYRAGESADIPSALAPVFARWEAEILPNQAEPVQAIVRRIFERIGRSRNLEQFDRNRRYLLDDKIDNLLNSASGRSRETARVLTQLRQELLGEVDNIPVAGEAYQAARNQFASRAAMRDALNAGRDAFRDESEVGVDAYRALTTEGERKLFRLGLLDSYTQQAAKMRSGADRLRLFDNPRIREILSEVLPRRGQFDNPERFGRFLDAEGRMIATRNEVVGNSRTAQRLADDEAYQALNSISEVFQATGSPTQAMLRAAERALRSVFGMRQDTSAEIARMLFTADPIQRQRNLDAIVRRMGANRAQQFANYMANLQGRLSGMTGRGAAALGEQ